MNDGNGGFTKWTGQGPQNPPPSPVPKSLCAAFADFDGDGDVDVYVGASGDTGNAFWRNDGRSSEGNVWQGFSQWGEGTDLSGVSKIYSHDTTAVAVGDFDYDGARESQRPAAPLSLRVLLCCRYLLVACLPASCVVASLLLLGWYSHSSSTGDLDIFLGASGGNPPGWANEIWLNPGCSSVSCNDNWVLSCAMVGLSPVTSSNPLCNNPGKSTAAAVVGDLDGDGDLDIFVTQSGSGSASANELLMFTHCSENGARLHGTSGCFNCPDHMARRTNNDVCEECLPDTMSGGATLDVDEVCSLPLAWAVRRTASCASVPAPSSQSSGKNSSGFINSSVN